MKQDQWEETFFVSIAVLKWVTFFYIKMSLLVTILTWRISADADNILELEMSLEPRISLIVTYTDIADIC